MGSVPRLHRFTNVATLVALLVGGNGPLPLHASELLRLTHGVASGDITATDAVVWARANRAARMVVEYTSVGAPTRPPARRDGPSVTAVDDFTGKVVLTGLTPDTRYLYWVRFVSESEQVVSEPGQFRTAPADGVARAVTLVWWGDLGGQEYCRDPERGYALFREMARLAPDLAVANGDSIYAESTCPPVTALPDHPRNVVSTDPDAALHQLVNSSDPRLAAAEVLAAYRGKWKYNLEDDAYRAFRAQTPHVYQWDDHEVINDWSPQEDKIGLLRGTGDARPMTALSGPGRKAFFEFTPIRPDDEQRIYRALRLGRLAELFVLDLRSYRDENFVPDGAGKMVDVRFRNGERRQIRGKAKTMLGAAQREWLLRGLRDAQARGVVWKIISTDDPLSIPTGGYPLFAPEGALTPLYSVRDAWAAGRRLNTDTDSNQGNPFGVESELRAILKTLKDEKITNLVWVATDVHHARLLRYEPAADLAGLVFHEFVAGPTSAISGPPAPLSTTFGPIELFAKGRRPDPARPSFQNFGVLRIGADGLLTVEVRGIDGAVAADDRGRVGALTLTPQR